MGTGGPIPPTVGTAARMGVVIKNSKHGGPERRAISRAGIASILHWQAGHLEIRKTARSFP